MRHYELTNHLGNVMAVISDRINIIPESTDDGSGTGGVPGDPNGGEDPFANPPTGGGPGGGGPYDGADPDAIADANILADVISVSDYYPFGLQMNGRTFSADTYRYGFNGKEKDDNGEWGQTHYDYGFRIYNPSIAKFLSVDPLASSYPWYTPYQFAGNTPIQAIDLDGAEPKEHYEFTDLYYGRGPNGLLKIIADTEILNLTEEEYEQQMLIYKKILWYNFITTNEEGKHVFDAKRAWKWAFKINNIDPSDSKVADISNTEKNSIFETYRKLRSRAMTALESETYDRWYFNNQDTYQKQEAFVNSINAKNRKIISDYRSKSKTGAVIDIVMGGVSVGFAIANGVTSAKSGFTDIGFSVASGVYGADKISGGINVLINLDELLFEPNKDYRIVGGFIQENLGNDWVVFYDLVGMGIDVRNIVTSSKGVIKGRELNNKIKDGLDALQTTGNVLEDKID